MIGFYGNYNDAVALLNQMRTRSIEEQYARKDDLLRAINEVWQACPTTEEWGRLMNGIVLFPEVLCLITGRDW